MSTLCGSSSSLLHRCGTKAKFHYAIQVADLLEDLRVRVVCRRPVESWSKASCEPVCDQVLAISTSSIRVGPRPGLPLDSAMEFDTQKSRELVAYSHELGESQVCDQVCDRSVTRIA